MKRRDFIRLTAATAATSVLLPRSAAAAETDHQASENCCRTYASPAAAMASPRETLLYVPCIYAGTETAEPDYLATIDVDPASAHYGQVIHRLPMPNVGDELHHFGWNACSSCHGDPRHTRRFLVVPGISSGRIHIIDAQLSATPQLHKVLEAEVIAEKTNLSAPHTVHCLADGTIMISMLGDANGNGPGGFLLLDEEFEIVGRWERDLAGMKFNYDFWYQPRQNVMVSSEWGAPNTVKQGFQPQDVAAGKYGRQLHFWDWSTRRIVTSVDLGVGGEIPLEVRFHHDPASDHGFVGAALGSKIFHWSGSPHDSAGVQVRDVIAVTPVEQKGWLFPVPGLITDLVLSMDDRWLYFSNWLHGDVRQYDVSDPSRPRLTAQFWMGGVLGKGTPLAGRKRAGGPQMLQLSLDGRRLYVTNSLYSPWDNQFYPDIAQEGSYLACLDCDTQTGGLTWNDRLLVDFGQEPLGPARAHEMRFPGGDCTSDIWV